MSLTIVAVWSIIVMFFRPTDAEGGVIINILHVNEADNPIADRAFESAIKYVQEHPDLGVEINVQRAVGKRPDAKGILTSLCSSYGKLVENDTPPHAVFDTTMGGFASETVKTFTAGLQLPTISASFGQDGHVRLWRNISEEAKKFLVQVVPPADVIPHVIHAIIKKEQITSAIIYYDSTFLMGHKVRLLNGFGVRHIMIDMTDFNKSTIEDQYRLVQKANGSYFFILGNLLSLKKMLEIADGINFFSRKFTWFVITQEQDELQFQCKNATILHIKPKLNPQHERRLIHVQSTYGLTDKPEIAAAFYFDLALKTFVTIRDMILNETWPQNLSYVTCQDYDGVNKPPRYGLDLRAAMQQNSTLVPTYGSFNITVNGESHMNFEMEISAVNFEQGSIISRKILGTWKAAIANASLELVEENSLKPYKADVVYRVITTPHEPYVIRDPNAPKNYSGYCVDLLTEIARVLNFDFEIYETEDSRFGQLGPHGEWNGIIKELVEKRADIALAAMSVMAERDHAVDFTVPFDDMAGLTILMKKTKQPTALFKFLTVLEIEVWLSILAAYFCTSLLMAIFDRYSPYSYQNNRQRYKDDEEKREFSFKECLWFCMTSLTPQGGGEAPKNLSGRLVAATWWLFGFIIIASYTANLAAFLTVSRLETPIESLDDLYKQYKIQYAPLNGSVVAQYFERMNNIEAKFYDIWRDMSLNDSLSEVERSKLAVWDYPVSDKYTKMWKAMKEAGFPLNYDEAIARVKSSEPGNDGFALIGDSNELKWMTKMDCDLEVIGEDFSKKPIAMAIQQNSPIKAKFDTVILSFLNNRFQEELTEKWWVKNPKIQHCKDVNPSHGITIENIGGVFIVIFLGIGLAILILMLEYWWYKYRRGMKGVRKVTPAPQKGGFKRGIDGNRGVVLRSRMVQPHGASSQLWHR